MEELLRYVLPRTPALAALVATTALLLSASVLLAPPRRRARPAALTTTGFLLGTIALVSTPGLRGPFLYDPTVLAIQRIAYTTTGSLFIAGVLCLLAAVILTLIRPQASRPRAVLSSAAGLLVGLGAPFTVRISLGRLLGTYEFHRPIVGPALIGLLVVAVLAATLVRVGARVVAVGVGIGAGAIPAGVLTAASSGLYLATTQLTASPGGVGPLLPTTLVLAASVCVGALGAGVWMMAGPYWADPEMVNPGGERRDSSSPSS